MKLCPIFKKECLRTRCHAYSMQYGKYIDLSEKFVNNHIFVSLPKREDSKVIRGYCNQFNKVIKEKNQNDRP